jgi:hypothetical protein
MIRKQVEKFTQNIRKAGIREMASKGEITSFNEKQTELLAALSVGSDWTEEQKEEREGCLLLK